RQARLQADRGDGGHRRVPLPRSQGGGREGASMSARPRKAPADRDKAVRDHVLYVLRDGGAHVGFDKAVAGLPARLRGARAKGLDFTPWRLLEHLRLAQWDILEFSRDPGHVSPKWPDGYWPSGDAPPGEAAWERSIKAFRSDLAAMQELVADPRSDLFTPFPHGDGQTL